MNIKTNSKKVKKKDIFIALKGDKYDGHDYIKEAISNGFPMLPVGCSIALERVAEEYILSNIKANTK